MSRIRPVLITTLRAQPTRLSRGVRPAAIFQRSLATTISNNIASTTPPSNFNDKATKEDINHANKSQQQQQTKETNTDPRLPMLKATLPFINQYGWSMESLIHGARSLGYPSVAHGLFPGGEAGLIDAYLTQQRTDFKELVKEKYMKGEMNDLDLNERVKVLTSLRLDMNKTYIRKWPEALAIMARPSNLKMSLKHLADIADDIWYYAGDRSPDMNWYTRRGSLAAIYSATEMFMISDMSPEFRETERFLNRRMNEAAWIGGTTRQLGTMLSFGAKSMLSMLNNRGGRL